MYLFGNFIINVYRKHILSSQEFSYRKFKISFEQYGNNYVLVEKQKNYIAISKTDGYLFAETLQYFLGIPSFCFVYELSKDKTYVLYVLDYEVMIDEATSNAVFLLENLPIDYSNINLYIVGDNLSESFNNTIKIFSNTKIIDYKKIENIEKKDKFKTKDIKAEKQIFIFLFNNKHYVLIILLIFFAIGMYNYIRKQEDIRKKQEYIKQIELEKRNRLKENKKGNIEFGHIKFLNYYIEKLFIIDNIYLFNVQYQSGEFKLFFYLDNLSDIKSLTSIFKNPQFKIFDDLSQSTKYGFIDEHDNIIRLEEYKENKIMCVSVMFNMMHDFYEYKKITTSSGKFQDLLVVYNKYFPNLENLPRTVVKYAKKNKEKTKNKTKEELNKKKEYYFLEFHDTPILILSNFLRELFNNDFGLDVLELKLLDIYNNKPKEEKNTVYLGKGYNEKSTEESNKKLFLSKTNYIKNIKIIVHRNE